MYDIFSRDENIKFTGLTHYLYLKWMQLSLIHDYSLEIREGRI